MAQFIARKLTEFKLEFLINRFETKKQNIIISAFEKWLHIDLKHVMISGY